MLGPLHFIWWIEANYKPSTHQELCYLNFDLTKWVQEKNCQIAQIMLWGQLRWQNDRNAILYDCSFSEEVERVLFHPLSSRFLKENYFWGGSCGGLFGLFGPEGALGCQKDDEKKMFQREANLTISRWNFVSLLFQICFLKHKRFLILPLDGGP